VVSAYHLVFAAHLQFNGSPLQTHYHRPYAGITPSLRHTACLDHRGHGRLRPLSARPCDCRKKGIGHGNLHAVPLPRSHYREVLKWIHQRGLITTPDQKDPYVGAFRQSLRQGSEVYFLDRLLTASIIEARGAERFALVADALESGPLKKFYQSIARSEARHFELFLELAKKYLDHDMIDQRWDELLDIEADIVATLPIRAALH
jgi:hypothetical protein